MLQINNQYLKLAYDEFCIRLRETESYILFVQKVSTMDKPHLCSDSESSSIKNTYEIDRELTKTLRASSYLMLYNLLESTMSNAIDAIHETIKSENRDIMDLSENLHKIILTNLQKGLSDNIINELSKHHKDHREDLFNIGYNKKKLFSGNVDCDIIKQYCRRYGFTTHPVESIDGKLTWDPKVIKEIKQKRNNLAHGSESFADCGQQIVIDTLHSNLEHVKAVLLGVFYGLNKYIDEKAYLKKSS